MFYFWGSLSKSKNKFEIWLGNDSIPLNNIKHQLPASSSTGLLQPLDTSAFSAFKHWIKRRNQQLRRTAQGGEALSFCGKLGHAPREFFRQQKMGSRFQSIGRGRDVTKLHSALQKFMQNPVSFPLPCQTHSSRDDSFGLKGKRWAARMHVCSENTEGHP